MELQYGENNFIKVDLPLTKVFHDATLYGDGTRQRPLRVLGGGSSLPDQTGNSGKYLTTNGTTASWGTVSLTPAGSDTQIQFNNAGAFGASANLAWTGTNLLVNASAAIGSLTAPTARLTITGTGTSTATSNFLIFNSALNTLFKVDDTGNVFLTSTSSSVPFEIHASGSSTGGLLIKSSSLQRFRLLASSTKTIFEGSNQTSTPTAFSFVPPTLTATSGTVGNVDFSHAFSPTSGTAIYNALAVTPTINQTGGANGITRGLYILPTLTSAADWRAIEATGQTRLIGTGATSATSALLVTNSAGTETLRVRDDGEVLINKDSSVTTQSSAVVGVQSADTNTNLVLFPKGTGAIIAGPPPDGTAVGGNARGTYAVDLQISKSSNIHVASAPHSGILSGWKNSASAESAVVVGGEGNIASGNYSLISGGASNTASGSFSGVFNGVDNVAEGNYSLCVGGVSSYTTMHAQVASASGRFSARSDAQYSILQMYRLVTGTAATELFLDSISLAAILPLPIGATNARVWNFTVSIVGVCHVAGGGTTVLNDIYSAKYQGAIKRVGSTTSLVGSVELVGTAKSDSSMSTSVVTIDANDTNESLRVQVTAPSTADGTTQIRWVAKVELVEVGR